MTLPSGQQRCCVAFYLPLAKVSEECIVFFLSPNEVLESPQYFYCYSFSFFKPFCFDKSATVTELVMILFAKDTYKVAAFGKIRHAEII